MYGVRRRVKASMGGRVRGGKSPRHCFFDKWEYNVRRTAKFNVVNQLL